MTTASTFRVTCCAAILSLSIGACGSAVSTAYRGLPPAVPGDAALVQVFDGSPEGELRLVSLSTYEAHPADQLPAAAPEDVVAAMRSGAARAGATRLYIERVDSPFRRAFYGLGVVPSPGATPAPGPCEHGRFSDALMSAARTADRCIALLRTDRPSLQGQITVVFQIDADGAVMRAAATPASTRDGKAQACALRAVHGVNFGAPLELTCAGSLQVGFGEEVAQ